MKAETRKAIADMTQDIKQLYKKLHLMPAITSHLTGSYGIPRAEAATAVAEYFAEYFAEASSNE